MVVDRGYVKPGVPDELKWAPVLRGFPVGCEVLTDRGWLSFESLWEWGLESGGLSGEAVDWRLEHKPLRENWLRNKSRFQRKFEFGGLRDVDFEKRSVGGSFPRLASLRGEHLVRGRGLSGGLEWVRPVFATRFVYEGFHLVRVKRRGVDLVLPRFTDVFARGRYQGRWGFRVVDDFTVVRDVNRFWWSMVNRFSPAGVLYGDVVGERLRGVVAGVESGSVRALLGREDVVRVLAGGRQAKHVTIDSVFGGGRVRGETGRFERDSSVVSSVVCHNFVLPRGSSHTLIVRREGRKVGGEMPHVEWVGYPVVVGDGYDKSLIPADKLEGFYR